MKYIAFDMDGTLYDCSEAIGEAYARTAKRLSEITGTEVPAPLISAIQSVLGNTPEHFFPVLFPSVDKQLWEQVATMCTEELAADVRLKKGKLYDGVLELFAHLFREGWKILIASNGKRVYLDAVLETYGLDRYLAMSPVTVEDKGVNTKSDILRRYRENLAIKNNVFMVGDRTSDLVAARDNGAFFVGCVFGHANGDEIAGADAVVHSIGEIADVIR
jgi:phosphoglycolate phosphatase